jgi:hypothetical protein
MVTSRESNNNNNKRKILVCLILLHTCFLLIDLLKYINSISNNYEATMHKLDLVFMFTLIGYFVIAIYCILKKEFLMLLITIIVLLIHMFLPTLNDRIKELLGVLTNVFLIISLSVLFLIRFRLKDQVR